MSKEKHLCAEPYCKKKKGARIKYCPKHSMQRWRASHPIEAAYHNLKFNAKRRGKVFTISLKYFRAFVIAEGYLEGKGKTKESLQIDREKEYLGYIEGNLTVKTGEANRKKYVEYHRNLKQEEGGIVTGDPDDVDF